MLSDQLHIGMHSLKHKYPPLSFSKIPIAGKLVCALNKLHVHVHVCVASLTLKFDGCMLCCSN